MDIEKIVVRFFADATPFQRAVDGVEGRLLTMSRSFGSLQDFARPAIIATTVAVTGLGVATGAAAWNAVSLANAYQQASVAFEVMTGSAETGKKILDELIQLAIETPFQSPELILGAQRLKAFGISADQLVPTLRMLGDVAAAVGMEKLPRIILAFGQVRSAGRLMGPELRQFFDAGVPMIEYLAKVMGKPEQAIKGMVEEAKIGFPEVVMAFKKMTEEGGIYFGMMDKQSRTVQGRWNALKETFQITLRGLGLAFFEEFGVAEGLDRWVKQLGTNPDNSGARRFFKDLRSDLEDIWHTIQIVFHVLNTVGNQVLAWVKTVVAGFSAWATSSRDLIIQLAKVAAGILLIVAAVRTLMVLYGIVAAIVAVFNSWWVIVGLLLVVLDDLGAFSRVFENFGQDFLSAWQQLLKEFPAIWKGITDAIAANDMKLAGEIAFKGLQFAWQLTLNAMEKEWEQFKSNLMNFFADAMWRASKTVIDLEWAIRRALPGFDDAEADRLWEKDMQQLNKLYDAQIEANRKVLESRKKDIDAQIEPIKRELDDLIKRAEYKVYLKKLEEDRAVIGGNPAFQAQEKIVQDSLVRYYQDLQKVLPGFILRPWWEAYTSGGQEGKMYLRNILTHRALNFKPNMTQEDIDKMLAADPTWQAFLEMQRIARELRGDNIAGRATNIPFPPGVPGAAAPGGAASEREGVRVPMTLRPEAVEFAQRTIREMERGIWAGQATDQFALFQRNLGLLEEGYYGPGGKEGLWGWMFARPGGPGSILNKEQFEFGVYEAYLNLKKNLKSETQFPRAMYYGSQEAQDAINKAQMETRTVQEEVRDTLREMAEVEKQQRDYQRQVVEELRRLRGDVEPDFGGGGDF